MKKLILCFLLTASTLFAGDIVNYGPPAPPKPDPEWLQIQKAIAAHQVLIGMSVDQCESAWGKPHKINRTIKANFVSEQWVYPSVYYIGNPSGPAQYDYEHVRYLYIDNGVLTSIQN